MFKKRTRKKNKEKKNLFSSTSLSFDDDDEEVFTVTKKSSNSIKNNINISNLKQDNLLHSSIGQYTKENLDNLKSQNKFQKLYDYDDNDNNNDMNDDIIKNINNNVINNMNDNIINLSDDDNDNNIDNDIFIPTSHAINNARNKREQIRRHGSILTEDFIPLDDNDSSNNSRLIRESFDDMEEDIYDNNNIKSSNNIQFGDPGKENQYINKDILMDDYNDFDDDPDAIDWENQQLKKIGMSFENASNDYTERIRNNTKSISLSDIPSVSQVMKDIKNKIEIMKNTYNNSINNTNRIKESLNNYKTDIESLKTKLNALLKQHEELTVYKSFIHDLMKCFELNIPTIDKLEANLSTEIENYLLEMKTIYFPNTNNNITNNNSLIKDEYGRDESLRKSIIIENYYKIKNKRCEDYSIESGFYSDDEYVYELKKDKQNHIENIKTPFNSLLVKLQDIFKETHLLIQEDLPSIQEILNIFIEWKEKHPSAYDSSYCESSLWAILSPLVRVELIFWDPLLFSCLYTEYKTYYHNSFTDMNWFSCLSLSSLSESKNVIIKLVEEELVPKIKDIIHSSWNVISSSQNKRIYSLVYTLREFYKTNNIEYTTLIQSILITILSSFHSTIKLFTTTLNQQDILTIFKILYNLFSWQELIPLSNMNTIINYVCESFIIPYFQSSNTIEETIFHIKKVLKQEFIDTFFQYTITQPLLQYFNTNNEK